MNKRLKTALVVVAALVAVAMLTGGCGSSRQRFAWVIADKLSVKNDTYMDTINEFTGGVGVTIDSVELKDDAVTAADVTTTDDVTVGDDLSVAGAASIAGQLDLARNVEHLGALSFITQSITYTAGSGVTGTLATIEDGEVWIVYDVFIQTTTTFTDTAGDDEAFIIGDGDDEDGFIVTTSTELASDFTEDTGYAAGFYGIENGSNGAYTVDDGVFVYAPSGSDETIDYALSSGAGDDIGAGALTMYLTYARIQ